MRFVFKAIILIVLVTLSMVITACNEALDSNLDEIDGFDWKQCEGTTITVAFNQHPYAESIIKKLSDFEELTGIKVKYTVTPEENYYDKLLTLLSRRSGNPDVFMAGPMQLWEYIFNDYVEPLDAFISDAAYTSEYYDIDDFFPAVLDSLKWSGIPGHKTGEGSIWGVPLGFEQYNLAYNKRILSECNMSPPRTAEELLQICRELNEKGDKDYYPIAVRGSQNWSMITSAYISLFSNYGAVDFEVENGKLVSRVNSQEAIEMTELWVELVKTGGPQDWESYTWYQEASDFGAGRAVMLLDADLVAYFQRPQGSSEEAQNIAWISMPRIDDNAELTSHLWCWGLSINSSSINEKAAWIFAQYFTSKDHLQWSAVNSMIVSPSRESVFYSLEYQKNMREADGFVEAFKETIDNASVVFTPQPHFFETTTLWKETVTDIITGKYTSTKGGMDALKKEMDKIVSDIEVPKEYWEK